LDNKVFSIRNYFCVAPDYTYLR